jgi:hypothetical protein
MNRVGRGTKIASAAALVAVTLAGCQVAQIGTACSGGVARDSVNILACRNGRWSKLMTIRQYAQALAARSTTTTARPPTTVPVGPGGVVDPPTTTTAPPTTTTSTTTTSTTTSTTTTSTTTTTAPSNLTGRFPNAPIQAWRVNGQGYASVLAGGTAYIGGDFTTATSYDGSQNVPRSHVAAFDATTGALRTGFVADTDGLVRDLAVSGSTLYIAGQFSTVNGTARTNLAAVDLATGAVTGWNPRPNAAVWKIAIGGGKLFLGGTFNYIGGAFHNHVGAVSLSGSGSVDGNFDTNLDAGVTGLGVTADGTRVFVSGPYRTVNGRVSANSEQQRDGTWRSFDALDSSGNPLGTTFGSMHGAALDMKVAGSTLYASTDANLVGRWSTNGGGRQVGFYCGGDGQAVAQLGNYLYGGFHDRCTDQSGADDLTMRLVRVGSNGRRDYSFAPSFDQFWGVRDINGDAGTMVIAGQFNWISNVRASGFAIFKAVG